ncbi:MAG: hydroxymethylglutaryl-CoA lyase [Bacteroidota bacterium]
MIKLIECPRDAMQGIEQYIPAQQKADYINALLKVGFDTIDFGSFVSPKAIPQLRDTAEVLAKLDMTSTDTKLLAIIGNLRGAEAAMAFDEISYLGFPYSSSKTFLKLNINTTPEAALLTIEDVNKLCVANKKEMIVYLSVAFGNPYGDDENNDSIIKAIKDLQKLGIKIIDLADTLGMGDAKMIGEVFEEVIPMFPDIEFGFHLHTTADSWKSKVNAAYEHGCRRFDSVILGLGGCPMSNKDMVGNLNTENLIYYFQSKDIDLNIDLNYYKEALMKAQETFSFIH